MHRGPTVPQALSGLGPRALQIVRTARELLEREGPDALSMRRLGAELGMRASSIYEHLRDKPALEAAMISVGFEEQAALFAEAVHRSDDPVAALAGAYRDFARRQPNLYRLMTERPLRRDLLAPGVEEAAARPLLDATGGNVELARAVWAFAHGMIILELNQRFPPHADLDAAWRTGLEAFRGTR
ncbi:TetR/AcrR family transcriptional regulator [Dactylosporangium sucinum]|uniref:TetR family transcriptional regulator n=1 Tax=Dactylosporangium sucinum TaxID=1424081 RepID=A0A917X0K7_9ACTN|nr:TetR/AcrR family transcriptional regulator [Dactylosporangium sucinum]GGM47827.1 TetR family transcriptional regulator [Dactylosporangium sucinum]